MNKAVVNVGSQIYRTPDMANNGIPAAFQMGDESG